MTTTKSLATCIASVLAIATYSGASQAEPVQLYGKVDVSLQSSDEGEGRFTELKSNSSRFGVKGDYALDNGLSLVYKLEWQVDVSDESSEKNIKSRNQYVGIKGNFGEVRLGRHDTALKVSQGKTDLFSDYEADVKHLWQGENRANDSISYLTPSFSGFGAQFTYIVADAKDADDAFSVAVHYGDEALKQRNFYTALAFDSDVKGYDILRATVQFKVAEFIINTMYQQQEEVATKVDKDGYLVGLAYPWQNFTFKTQYQVMEDDNGASLGVDYKLGKDTKLYAWYSSFDFEQADNTNYLAVGISHKF